MLASCEEIHFLHGVELLYYSLLQLAHLLMQLGLHRSAQILELRSHGDHLLPYHSLPFTGRVGDVAEVTGECNHAFASFNSIQLCCLHMLPQFCPACLKGARKVILGRVQPTKLHF